MTTFDRIKELASKRDKSLKDVAIEIGLSENIFYTWKKSSPKTDVIQKVADYFNVTVDYLLGREEKEEEGFVTFFRANTSDLSDDKKQLLEEELMAFMEARRKFLDGKGK